MKHTLHGLEFFRSDAFDPQQIPDPEEGPGSPAVGDDGLGRSRPDTWQALQGQDVGPIRIQGSDRFPFSAR